MIWLLACAASQGDSAALSETPVWTVQDYDCTVEVEAELSAPVAQPAFMQHLRYFDDAEPGWELDPTVTLPNGESRTFWVSCQSLQSHGRVTFATVD